MTAFNHRIAKPGTAGKASHGRPKPATMAKLVGTKCIFVHKNTPQDEKSANTKCIFINKHLSDKSKKLLGERFAMSASDGGDVLLKHFPDSTTNSLMMWLCRGRIPMPPEDLMVNWDSLQWNEDLLKKAHSWHHSILNLYILSQEFYIHGLAEELLRTYHDFWTYHYSGVPMWDMYQLVFARLRPGSPMCRLFVDLLAARGRKDMQRFANGGADSKIAPEFYRMLAIRLLQIRVGDSVPLPGLHTFW